MAFIHKIIALQNTNLRTHPLSQNLSTVGSGAGIA